MQFRQVTATKYIGSDGYSLIKASEDHYVICKNGQVTKWGSNFVSVKAAQAYMTKHDYKHASTNVMPLMPNDIDEIADALGAEKCNCKCGCIYKIDDTYSFASNWIDNYSIPELQNKHILSIDLFCKGNLVDTFVDLDSFLDKMDVLLNDGPIVAAAALRGLSLRNIVAKRQRRSVREIIRDLVRVKSSNVWAIGMEVKDAKAGVGDVYVQFKGRNGGAGDVYSYLDVPVRLYQKLVAAPSKGHAFWKYLRNNFLYRKLTGDRRGVLPNAVNY